MRIDDHIVSAYVDGELDAAEAARIDAAARADPDLARRIKAQQRLRERMAGVFSSLITEAPPERLVAAVQKPRTPAEVVDLGQIRRQRAARTAGKTPTSRWFGWMVMAACAVLVASWGFFYAPDRLISAGGSIVAGPPGAMVARGSLANALDSQLASAGVKPGDIVRIGVSFRANTGGYCRTFAVTAGDPFSGLACHGPKGWRIRATAADDAEGAAPAYRQASTEISPTVIAAVEGLIQGEPLNAQQETAARAGGWKP
jgi:hypothetical protein